MKNTNITNDDIYNIVEMYYMHIQIGLDKYTKSIIDTANNHYNYDNPSSTKLKRINRRGVANIKRLCNKGAINITSLRQSSMYENIYNS